VVVVERSVGVPVATKVCDVMRCIVLAEQKMQVAKTETVLLVKLHHLAKRMLAKTHLNDIN
jgi:hypothetical protein